MSKRFTSLLATILLVVANVAFLPSITFASTGPSFTGYAVPTPNSYPTGITTGPDGNVWFTEYLGHKIGKITPDGVIQEYSVSGNPTSIAASPDGLWFGPNSSKRLTKLSTSGVTTHYPLAVTDNPYAVATGPNGDVWFTEFSPGKLGKFTPSNGSFTEYSVPIGAAGALTVDGQHNVWIADYNNNRVVKVDANGNHIATYPTPSANSHPQDIVTDSNGNAWFAEATISKIGRVATNGVVTEFSSSHISSPRGLTVGPNGNIWFVGGNGRLGEITPAGTVTSYTPPSPYLAVDDITLGADGNLWYTHQGGNTIGKAIFTLPAPSGLAASSPAQSPSLNWAAVSSATSYNIYRDSAYVDTTTQTNYIDSNAPEGTHAYHVTAANSSAESGPSNTVSVLVDRTAPTITYDVTPAPNANGWSNNDLTVTFACGDESSGIAACGAPVTVSTEGSGQTVTGSATDNAGNTASATVNVSLDKTAPIITATPSQAPNANGWNNTPVTVTYACSDTLSDIQFCSAPETKSTDGSYLLEGVAQDNADNVSAATIAVNIDQTAPVVNMPAWSANPLQQGQNTTLSTTVSDSLSGISSVQYSIDGGTPQAMTFDSASGTWRATFGSALPANTYNVTITATDNAGNTSTGTVDILAVYTTANGYVTGHAKILPSASDTMPIALDTSNNPTKLVLGLTNVTAPMSGSFDLNYSIKKNQNEFSLSSTGINWVVVQDSTHASILGHADLTTFVNGAQTVTQNVSVRFDIALDANGDPDQITIKIFNPGLNPNTDSPTYIITGVNFANGSNLMIHP